MENIPREFNKIPPVTKFIVTATAIVSVPTMLGIFPATSIVFDPYGVMYRHEVWRLGTSWFYAPSSEFFLFVAGMFLLYHSAFNIETNLFQGRSADFAWQVILSGIAILTLNVPLKTHVLSQPLLHLLIYPLDSIVGGPMNLCRSLTGITVAYLWAVLIPRPSVLQMAESKTSDDGPKKPSPGWRKYTGAPGWMRKVIPWCAVDGGWCNSTSVSLCTARMNANTSPMDAIAGAEDVTETSYGATSVQTQTKWTGVAAINRLPPEILIRIFEYCHYLWRSMSIKKERADSPAVWDRSIRALMDLGYPETLSHVCTLWRDIALSTPTLWSYLDLFTLGQSAQTFTDRGSAFIPRAQNQELILRVRLRHDGAGPPPNASTDTAKGFCGSVAPRLRSLLIDNHGVSDSALFTSLIQATLPNTTPGTLLNLFIKDYGPRSIPSQTHNPDGLAGWELPSPDTCGVSPELFDSILRPIKSLRLGSYFFPWSSPAYHGLVELHLLFTRPRRGHRPYVHVHKLRDMLLASPGLRILHINITVVGKDDLPGLPPVPLPELEELNLRGMSRGVYDTVLPLLSPGKSTPLQFTFQTEQQVNARLYCPTVRSFLKRANVTSLYVLGRSSFDQRLSVEELLAESPRGLRTLGIERLQILAPSMDETRDVRYEEGLHHVSRLYIRKCVIDVDAFKSLVGMFDLDMLKLHKPEFRDRSHETSPTTTTTTTTTTTNIGAMQEINKMGPRSVKWVRSSRDMELWDAWEVEYDDDGDGDGDGGEDGVLCEMCSALQVSPSAR
ncbi:Derlin [Rhizoctonia solani]|uniref:Derlin n=1 Tax=Rhizoctonia solani TaxID=456999 RepID=A0A8H7H1G4_9AGAM|nr:Derlin [Rhizoctonia solani]